VKHVNPLQRLKKFFVSSKLIYVFSDDRNIRHVSCHIFVAHPQNSLSFSTIIAHKQSPTKLTILSDQLQTLIRCQILPVAREILRNQPIAVPIFDRCETNKNLSLCKNAAQNGLHVRASAASTAVGRLRRLPGA
jgi:hypothetical protein